MMCSHVSVSMVKVSSVRALGDMTLQYSNMFLDIEAEEDSEASREDRTSVISDEDDGVSYFSILWLFSLPLTQTSSTIPFCIPCQPSRTLTRPILCWTTFRK